MNKDTPPDNILPPKTVVNLPPDTGRRYQARIDACYCRLLFEFLELIDDLKEIQGDVKMTAIADDVISSIKEAREHAQNLADRLHGLEFEEGEYDRVWMGGPL